LAIVSGSERNACEMSLADFGLLWSGPVG
jgi:hypothetical protein